MFIAGQCVPIHLSRKKEKDMQTQRKKKLAFKKLTITNLNPALLHAMRGGANPKGTNPLNTTDGQTCGPFYSCATACSCDNTCTVDPNSIEPQCDSRVTGSV
jgi:hypothetical protein